MGSLLTEGEHLFLDRNGDWQSATRLLLEAAAAEQHRCQARVLALRDFPDDDPAMDAFLLQQGFTKLAMPDSFVLGPVPADDEQLCLSVSRKSRCHLRRSVLPYVSAFDIEVLRKGDGRTPSEGEWQHIFQLYRNVKGRNLEINTFDLPQAVFRNAIDSPSWELVLLYARSDCNTKSEKLPICVIACFVGSNHYSPMVIGLDYRWVESHGAYRAALHTVLKQAREYGLDRIYLGMGAPLEKSRFGAKTRRQCVYVKMEDHYNSEVLEHLKLQMTTETRGNRKEKFSAGCIPEGIE